MIDEIKMEVLTQRLETTQEASKRAYDKFSNILDSMNSIYCKVNGYPERSIELLNDIIKSLEKLENAIVKQDNNIEEKPKDIKVFLYFLSTLFLTIIGSFLGVFAYVLIFNH